MNDTPELVIDRKQESIDVLTYQSTQDPDLLSNIVSKRIPTLQTVAQKHYEDWMYPVIGDVEDLAQALAIPLVNSINSYKPHKVDYNTYLYTSLLNYIRNIVSARFAKKRIHHGEYSLDNKISDNDGGEAYIDNMSDMYCKSPYDAIDRRYRINQVRSIASQHISDDDYALLLESFDTSISQMARNHEMKESTMRNKVENARINVKYHIKKHKEEFEYDSF